MKESVSKTQLLFKIWKQGSLTLLRFNELTISRKRLLAVVQQTFSSIFKQVCMYFHKSWIQCLHNWLEIKNLAINWD